MQKMPLLSRVGPMQSSRSPGQVTEFLSCWNLKDLNVHPAPPRTRWSKRCSFCVRGAERKQIQTPLTHRSAQNAPAHAYASANANTWQNQATSVLWYLDVQHHRDPTTHTAKLQVCSWTVLLHIKRKHKSTATSWLLEQLPWPLLRCPPQSPPWRKPHSPAQRISCTALLVSPLACSGCSASASAK